VGLAGAGVADQAERLALADPVAGGQGVDEGGADGGVANGAVRWETVAGEVCSKDRTRLYTTGIANANST
jgi:hypothetical protein